jgi:hypothetical protein
MNWSQLWCKYKLHSGFKTQSNRVWCQVAGEGCEVFQGEWGECYYFVNRFGPSSMLGQCSLCLLSGGAKAL